MNPEKPASERHLASGYNALIPFALMVVIPYLTGREKILAGATA